MALDFTGIVKKRVPFVPYVQTAKNATKPKETIAGTTGHTAHTPMSSLSTTGHRGHDWTHTTLKDMKNASHCHKSVLAANGQVGHAGQTITDEDVEFFMERAGISEFEGQLCRDDANTQAYGEWQAWRSKQTYH